MTSIAVRRAYVVFMRRAAMILLLALAFAPATRACCITVTVHPTDFFANARAIFHARAVVRDQVLVVERTVLGDVPPGARFSYPPHVRCNIPEDGKGYLVGQYCREDEPCAERWVDETDAPRMFAFMKQSHAETHETVMAAARQWLRGDRSLDDLREWIDTTAIKPRGKEDDEFLLGFLRQLRQVLDELNEIESCDPSLVLLLRQRELAPVAPLLASFPKGTVEEFDLRLEESGNDDAKWRGDYNDELMLALENALESAEWRIAWENCRRRTSSP